MSLVGIFVNHRDTEYTAFLFWDCHCERSKAEVVYGCTGYEPTMVSRGGCYYGARLLHCARNDGKNNKKLFLCVSVVQKEHSDTSTTTL